jgi:hypothetical protein
LAYFTSTFANIPTPGTGYVQDGSAATYAQMTLFQGPESGKPGTPTTGSIYFALDSGRTYYAQSGSWEAFDPTYTGDVTKPAGSDVLTLATVNGAVGTWGDSSNFPIITVNEKGLVTNVTTEPIPMAPGSTPGGTTFSVQFNQFGSFGGDAILKYDPTAQKLFLKDQNVSGQITFANPLPTFNNLSPLTTKGDIVAHNATNNVRIPVGTDGEVLTADSTQASGLKWATTGKSEFPFDYGDATPKNLFVIQANKVIESVSIIVMTAFNDVFATLAVGDTTDPASLLLTTDNAPGVTGTYTTEPAIKYGSATQLNLSISPGTSTQGSGLVVITYQK